jgi:hypothetical protein
MPDNGRVDDELDEGIIYIGYGDLMRKLQLMELHLWQIQALRMNPKMQAKHAFEKVEKLDGTAFGSLVRGMKTQDHWPEGMVDDLLQAVALRNYLAHNFLREFFLAEPSQDNYARGAQRLVDWHEKVDALDAALETHIATMSDATWDDLDDDLKAEIEAMRPKIWPLTSADDPTEQRDSP